MFLLIVFLLSVVRISAQSFQAPALLGMGNTAAAYQGANSIVANPAGMARVQTFSIGAAYQMHYLLVDLYTYGIYAVIPTIKVGVLGVQYNQYNSTGLMQQTAWKLNYAYAFATSWSAAIGLQQSSLRWESDTFPRAVSMEMGVLYHRNSLSLGGFVKQFSIGNTADALLPEQALELALGMNYLFSEQIYLATDIFWESRQKPGLRTGLEYRLHRDFCLRGGISSYPLQYYLGTGILLKKMQIDMATSIHRALGISPQIGLSYVF